MHGPRVILVFLNRTTAVRDACMVHACKHDMLYVLLRLVRFLNKKHKWVRCVYMIVFACRRGIDAGLTRDRRGIDKGSTRDRDDLTDAIFSRRITSVKTKEICL